MDTQHTNQLSHEAALELLPWHVNASLDVTLQKQVTAHVEQCDRCQKEAALLGNTMFAVNAEEPRYGQVDENFKVLMNRIDASEQIDKNAPHSGSSLDRFSTWMNESLLTLTGLRNAGVAAALVVAITAGIFANLPVEEELPPYIVMGSGESVILIVHLVEPLAENEMRGLVATAGKGFKVEHQSDFRYLVTLPAKNHDGDVAQLLMSLKSNPNVQRIDVPK